jgi:DNA-binding NarL/FixJ family response regulator
VDPATQPIPEPIPETGIFKPRTVLCERHELIRFGLKRLVSEVVEIIGEAQDGLTATEVVSRLKPEFILMDVDLDGLDGVEVCRSICLELPNSRLLVLTDSYHATKFYNQLLRAGAHGFCLKSSGPRTLFEAIKQVTTGSFFCDSKLSQLVTQPQPQSMPDHNLSDREIQVLIRLEMKNKDIAEELEMNLRTVEKHVDYILQKLKVPTRTAATLRAIQYGFELLPKMPSRDPVTGITHEQTTAELQAELVIANEHLKALLKQQELLKGSLSQRE